MFYLPGFLAAAIKKSGCTAGGLALEEGRFDGGHESTDIVELMSALPTSAKSVSLARVCALLHRLLCFDHSLGNDAETILSMLAVPSLMVFNQDN